MYINGCRKLIITNKESSLQWLIGSPFVPPFTILSTLKCLHRSTPDDPDFSKESVTLHNQVDSKPARRVQRLEKNYKGKTAGRGSSWNMLKMESKPRNQLRDWHKRMRQAWRSTGHQTRDVETEEENIQESIKKDAKRSALTTSVKALGKERFGSKGTVNHLYEHKSLITSIPKHLGESVAIAQNIGNVSKISHWMKLAKKAHQVAPTVNHSSKINLDMRFQIDPQNCAKPFGPYEYNNRMKAQVGNVKEVLRLFTKMKENGCNPNVLCYNTVLDCLVMNKCFEEVVVVYDEMIALKISPNVSTWNILVKHLCYQGQFDEAFKILSASGCNPDVRTYSTIISGLIRERRVEDAYDLLYEMLDKGYHPNIYTYTPIVQGLCAKGEINDAKQLIELMWQKGCPPNSVTYKFLLDALCKLGNFDEVESILKESGSKGWKPNANSYNIYIKGLCMAGKVEEAHRKLEDFMDGSYNFDCNVGYLIYNTVMNSFCESLKEQENTFCKLDKLITVLKLLTDMLKKGVVPNTGTYNIVVHSLCEAGMPSKAKLIVQCRGFAVDVVTYNTLINGFYRVRKFEEVEHLYHKMTTMDNINPDMFTYTILIGMYCTQGEVLKAERLLEKAVRMGFSPDLVAYGALIDGCLKKREFVLGWKVFDRMQEQGLVPNFIIFDSLIRACCEELNTSHVCNTIDKVLRKR